MAPPISFFLPATRCSSKRFFDSSIDGATKLPFLLIARCSSKRFFDSHIDGATKRFQLKEKTVPPKKVAKTVKRKASNASTDSNASSSAKKKKIHEVVINSDSKEVLNGGHILTFGQGDVGQLGLGEDIMEKKRPAVVEGYDDVIAIAAGGMHNVCLRKNGEVITFGCNDEGALGRDTSVEGSETTPGAVSLPGKAIQITAGDSHSAALLDDGKVFAWGSFRDSHGNMGLTVKGNKRTPIEMLPNVHVVKIASGADHLVFLTKKGLIYTCGCAEQGQLGRRGMRIATRDTRQGVKPLLEPDLVNIKQIKSLEFSDIWAGLYCTFLKEDKNGHIYVFGLNNYYQIGLKKDTAHFYPTISETFNGKNWKHISSGQHHTVALDDTGKVYVLGRKEYGRLGLGPDCSDAQTLVEVPALSSKKCVHVAAGNAQSFAVTESGEVYAWGMGTGGQLGTGEEDDVDTPTLVKGKQLEDKKVLRVSGGGQHTIVLASKRKN